MLDRSDNPWVGGPKRRNTSGQLVSERVEEVDEEGKTIDTDGPGNKEPEGSKGPTHSSAKGDSTSNHEQLSTEGASNIENPMSNLSLNEPAPAVDKPETDFARIKWSYVDPYGNVQGG